MAWIPQALANLGRIEILQGRSDHRVRRAMSPSAGFPQGLARLRVAWRGCYAGITERRGFLADGPFCAPMDSKARIATQGRGSFEM